MFKIILYKEHAFCYYIEKNKCFGNNRGCGGNDHEKEIQNQIKVQIHLVYDDRNSYIHQRRGYGCRHE
jgi:hypothetical protein